MMFTLPSGSLKPLSIEYVNDVYRGISAKNCSRDERGQFETRMHLQSLEQKMQLNKEWSAFFQNIFFINLQLISVLMILYSQACCQYWLTTKMKYSKYQVVSQSFLNATTKKAILEQFALQQYHALQQKANVAVDSKDTDVLVLMTFAYAFNKVMRSS